MPSDGKSSHCRTTRDYDLPQVAPRIQAALDAALQDEEDIDIEGGYVILENI
jgi:kinesin family protein 3/17